MEFGEAAAGELPTAMDRDFEYICCAITNTNRDRTCSGTEMEKAIRNEKGKFTASNALMRGRKIRLS